MTEIAWYKERGHVHLLLGFAIALAIDRPQLSSRHDERGPCGFSEVTAPSYVLGDGNDPPNPSVVT